MTRCDVMVINKLWPPVVVIMVAVAVISNGRLLWPQVSGRELTKVVIATLIRPNLVM